MTHSMTQSMKIGVGISTWNRPEALRTCVAKCAKHNFSGYRIFVTDDGSTPENWGLARQIALEYGAEMNEKPNENVGVAGNCNRIIAHFEGCDYIAILMDDGMPISDAWISDHILAHQETGYCIFLCPHYGDTGGLYSQRALSNGAIVNIQSNTSGPLTFLHRKVWETVGGYDGRMTGIHYDDIELVSRVVRAGLAGPYSGAPLRPGTPSLAHVMQLVGHQDIAPCMTEEQSRGSHLSNMLLMEQSFQEVERGEIWRPYKGGESK